jgi:hypothetical protein
VTAKLLEKWHREHGFRRRASTPLVLRL